MPAAPPNAEDRVGQVLNGKYAVERFLGAGGMAEVYLATNRLVGRPVALKLLRAEFARQREARERFLREARAAGAVRHRNIVDILDVDGLGDGTMYIVQEYLEGEDLAARIRRGRLTPAEAVDIMLPVAEAISHAHKQGIVHRDLKPDNVFLAREDEELVPKVLDFGISKLPLHDEIRRSANEPARGRRLTAAGAAMGTPYYMSPEQIRDPSSVGASTDVWSFGVILYEALAGAMPFDAEELAGLFGLICSGKAPSLARRAPDIPKPLVRVVERCLSPDPAARYADAGEVAEALANVRGRLSDDDEAGASQSNPPPGDEAPPRHPSIGQMAAVGGKRSGKPRRRPSRKLKTYDPNEDPRNEGTAALPDGVSADDADPTPGASGMAAGAFELDLDVPKPAPRGSHPSAAGLELDLPKKEAPAPRASAPSRPRAAQPRSSQASADDLLGPGLDDWDDGAPLNVDLEAAPDLGAHGSQGASAPRGGPASRGGPAPSPAARASAASAASLPASRRVQVRRHADAPPDFSAAKRLMRLAAGAAGVAIITVAGQVLTPAGLTELDAAYGAQSFMPLTLGMLALLAAFIGVGSWAIRLPSIPLFVSAAALLVLTGSAAAGTALVAAPGLVPVTLRKAMLLAAPWAAMVGLGGLGGFAISTGRELMLLEQKTWSGVVFASAAVALGPIVMLSSMPFPTAASVAELELGPRASAITEAGAQLGTTEAGAAILPRRSATPRSPSPLGERKPPTGNSTPDD